MILPGAPQNGQANNSMEGTAGTPLSKSTALVVPSFISVVLPLTLVVFTVIKVAAPVAAVALFGDFFFVAF